MKYFIDGQEVRLPHNVGELPLHYACADSYQTVCGYRRILNIPREIIGSKIFLQFDGAAHDAEIFLNGQSIARHRCAYTSFRVDISDLVQVGKNQLAVKLDCTENPLLPPFGDALPYLTYGGLFRDVFLDIRPNTFIQDIFVSTVDKDTIHVDVTCSGTPMITDIEIYNQAGGLVVIAKDCAASCDIKIPYPKYWSPKHPNLYQCCVTIKNEDYIDVYEVPFGMRTCEWRADGLYLNGEKTFLRGLTHDAAYPYIGKALPEHLLREDARMLKEELGVNAVRTSHCPPSRFFLDECDKQGILVFAEMPGYAYIGDELWQEQALQNLEEMIMQSRNHPSIILWGTRVSDSTDADDFYEKTNALAHRLDPYRATSGARQIGRAHV